MSNYLKKFTATSLSLIVLSIGSSILNASTLSTNFADVYIDNLKIGGSYNLTEVANLPMWVSWRGDSKARIVIEPTYPRNEDLKTGYEPIPDVSWIKLSRNEFEILPDESHNLDVTIEIPNDKKYLGKKYQCYLHITAFPPLDNQTSSGMAFALAVKGKILFGIAPIPPSEKELIDLRKKKIRATQGVIITPDKFEIILPSSSHKLTPKIDITQDIPLKIINTSMEKVEVTLESVEADISGVSLPRGYKKGNAPNITFSKRKFTISPDGIENIKIYCDNKLNLPKEEANKYFYVIKIHIKSPTIEVAKFVRIYVN